MSKSEGISTVDLPRPWNWMQLLVRAAKASKCILFAGVLRHERREIKPATIWDESRALWRKQELEVEGVNMLEVKLGVENGDREAGQSILLFDLFLITSFQGKQTKHILPEEQQHGATVRARRRRQMRWGWKRGEREEDTWDKSW